MQPATKTSTTSFIDVSVTLLPEATCQPIVEPIFVRTLFAVNADPRNQWVPLPAPPAPACPAIPAPPQRTDDAAAVTIFVLGLLGLVFCAFLAPFAWIKGASYRKTCRILELPPNGLATAGWALGIVGTMMLLLSFFAVIAVRAIGP